MNQHPSSDEQPRRAERERLSRISLALGILALVGIAGTFISIEIASHTIGDLSPYLICGVTIILGIIGVGLGIAGWPQAGQSKAIPIAGLALNSSVLLYVIVSVIIGMS